MQFAARVALTWISRRSATVARGTAAADHRVDPVAGLPCVVQSLEDDDGSAFADE
jgi:hypothetical protein